MLSVHCPSNKLLTTTTRAFTARGVIPIVPGSYSPQVLCSPLCMRRGNIGPFYFFYFFWDLYSPLFPKRVLCSPFCMSRGKGSYVPLWNPGNIGPGEHRTLFIGLNKGPMFPSQQVWPVWQIQFISIPTFLGFYFPLFVLWLGSKGSYVPQFVLRQGNIGPLLVNTRNWDTLKKMGPIIPWHNTQWGT